MDDIDSKEKEVYGFPVYLILIAIGYLGFITCAMEDRLIAMDKNIDRLIKQNAQVSQQDSKNNYEKWKDNLINEVYRDAVKEQEKQIRGRIKERLELEKKKRELASKKEVTI